MCGWGCWLGAWDTGAVKEQATGPSQEPEEGAEEGGWPGAWALGHGMQRRAINRAGRMPAARRSVVQESGLRLIHSKYESSQGDMSGLAPVAAEARTAGSEAEGFVVAAVC